MKINLKINHTQVSFIWIKGAQNKLSMTKNSCRACCILLVELNHILWKTMLTPWFDSHQNFNQHCFFDPCQNFSPHQNFINPCYPHHSRQNFTHDIHKPMHLAIHATHEPMLPMPLTSLFSKLFPELTKISFSGSGSPV